MAEREDLELQRRTAPEGSEKRGQKSGQKVPEGESKEERQPSVYQSDQDLREPPPIVKRVREILDVSTSLWRFFGDSFGEKVQS